MPKLRLTEIIETFLGFDSKSLGSIISPNVIRQIEEIRGKTHLLETHNHDFSEIQFNSDDTIDNFQKNIYNLDELLSKSIISTPEQLENLVRLLDNMLDYITQSREAILSLESIKLNNIKNNFRAIQTIIKSKITLHSQGLTQIISSYNQVYSYIIPNLPHFINPKKHTDYLNNLSFDDFDESNKIVFRTMIQDLKNICSQVMENTDSFKNLQENELYELQHSLEKLLNVVNSKLIEIDTKNEVNSDNLLFPRTVLTTINITIKNAKEKVIRSIRKKEVERDLNFHIEVFPKIEKESLIDDIDPYKKFIEQINKIYRFIIENKDIITEMNHEYILEIKNFLKNIKEKLDYVIEQHNPENKEHLKFVLPANRLTALIGLLLEKLEFNQVSFQN